MEYQIFKPPVTIWWIVIGDLNISCSKNITWFSRFMMKLIFGWDFRRA